MLLACHVCVEFGECVACIRYMCVVWVVSVTCADFVGYMRCMHDICVCSIFLVNSWSMFCVWYTHGCSICVMFLVCLLRVVYVVRVVCMVSL